ncbi:MAG: serine--tRNA ligase [Patescibacteria group bacterium]|jgi:seryl-tRNA synthetase
MLDIKLIRSKPELYIKALDRRGCGHYISELLKVDADRRRITKELDDLRAAMNNAAKEIGTSSNKDRVDKIESAQKLKSRVKNAEDTLNLATAKYNELIYKLPNIPFEEVPVGDNEEANVVLREVGKKPKFTKPQDYLTIAEKKDWIDIERASKVSGTRFGYIKGDLAMVQFSLAQMVFRRLGDQKWLSKVIKKTKLDLPNTSFVPMVPPVMIRPEVFRAMGKLDPGQEEERYHLPSDGLYLVGSAEHTLGPYFMNETLSAKDLPIRFIGYSTCFRREAGSYGKDTKGILRVHQFDKLEMFSYSIPEFSRMEHKLFLAIQEELMRELKLPYRVVHVCTGDMVSTDAEQFDIETWMPGQNNGLGEYRETHSTSNSTDFQARRLNIKYRNGEKTELVHTINGTAFAIGRTLIGLIENTQGDIGSVNI